MEFRKLQPLVALELTSFCLMKDQITLFQTETVLKQVLELMGFNLQSFKT